MKNMKYYIFMALMISVCTTQAAKLTLVKSFGYPQTPTFLDETQPGNARKLDTAADLQKRQRMSDPGGPRRSRDIKYIYVCPGGLEANEHIFALDGFLDGFTYNPGSFSFSGPADSLLCVTGFAWGTENNNGNFLPLLISRAYQDVKTPTYNFTWSKLPEYQQTGPIYKPLSGEISLNYEFKVPVQSELTRVGSRNFVKFSLAGRGSFGTPPLVVPKMLFTWRNGVLETFVDGLRTSYQVRNSIRTPMDYVCEGFAVDKAAEIVYLVDNQAAISAYRVSGELLWQSGGRGPLMTYDKYLIAVSDNYQSIMMLDKATGKTLSSVELPALLPRFENSFAIISSVSDAMLIMSIPQQSRLLCYRITP